MEEENRIHGGSSRRREKLAANELQTGGPLDAIGGAIGGAADAVIGTGDFLLGGTDEAIARQFDDEPGGGIIDGTREFLPFLEQPESVTERQVEEGILPEERAQEDDVAASDAELIRAQPEVLPGETAEHLIRISNGLRLVRENSPNSAPPDEAAAFDPQGAIVGAGAGVAAALASGATVGSVAGPPGTLLGAAGGLAGTFLRPTLQDMTGGLGYTITAAIDGEVMGQAVVPVGTPLFGLGPRTREVNFKHSVPPQPGNYTVNMVVSMWKTGNIVDEFSTEITVADDATSERDFEGNRNNNNNNNNNGGQGFDIIGFAKENPGIAALTAGGSLVALNAFAGGLGEGFGQDTTVVRAGNPNQ